ncbi:hypothetical protein [Listeria monocytogenes]|uniref:Uncharacterized protein n=2 Tax=Listeria monocytogenes TaxID=1639 RepID=A0A6C8MZW9_LISMN|nr:hypothetical protein [Listeria monocytogenes]KAA9534136.1 hypothetical protein DCK33_08330 [Listeria monocytogenes]KAA9541439.1 hypothetical protein DCK32_10135 [Listeria monocytogenes]
MTLDEFLENLDDIRRYCMETFGWTVKQVNEQPYEQLLKLIISEEEKRSEEEKAVPLADFVTKLQATM